MWISSIISLGEVIFYFENQLVQVMLGMCRVAVLKLLVVFKFTIGTVTYEM